MNQQPKRRVSFINELLLGENFKGEQNRLHKEPVNPKLNPFREYNPFSLPYKFQNSRRLFFF